jgi:hypothetical protein
MIRFIRFVTALVPSLLLAHLCACELSTDTTARGASSCGDVVPALTPWNGQLIPGPATASNALIVCESPVDAKRLIAYAVDGGKVAATLDLPAEQLGAFLATQLQASAVTANSLPTGSPARYETIVVKGMPCDTTQHGVNATAPTPLAPPFAAQLEDMTQAMVDARDQVIADYASGKVCPLSPPQK